MLGLVLVLSPKGSGAGAEPKLNVAFDSPAAAFFVPSAPANLHSAVSVQASPCEAGAVEGGVSPAAAVVLSDMLVSDGTLGFSGQTAIKPLRDVQST